MALAPLANMTWRTFIDIFAGEFAEHPNGKKAVVWLRECIKGLNEEDLHQINFRLRLAYKRARRAEAEPETRHLTPSYLENPGYTGVFCGSASALPMTVLLLASMLLSSLNNFAQVATPQTVTLNNGLVMPKLAFAANVWPTATCRNATHLALDAGFRFVWSSALVHSECQRAQREAISEHPTVRRADLFLAGTVDTQGCATLDDCRSATLAGAQAQFRILGPEPLEMLMLDYPSSAGCAGITGQWQALTALYRAGKVRSVAVSNFAAAQLSCLLSAEGEGGAAVPPVANQMRFYVGHTGVDLALNARHGIVVQAYSPLGNGALIYASAAPAATKLEPSLSLSAFYQERDGRDAEHVHLAEDAALFGWSLGAAEMARLDVYHRRVERLDALHEATAGEEAPAGEVVPPSCPPGTVPWPGEACEPLRRAEASARAFLRANMFPFDAPNTGTLFDNFSASTSSGVAQATASLALSARARFGWAASVPRRLFEGYVLPYASVNEARTDWRQLLWEALTPQPWVEALPNASSIESVAVAVNRNLWGALGNLTGRRAIRFKSDQTPLVYDPLSTILFGYASCTGVSIAYVDALRTLGVPARLAGTPAWHGKPEAGNHNWVEWFCNKAHFGEGTRVFAAAFRREEYGEGRAATHYPMAWDLDNKGVVGVDRSEYYASVCGACGGVEGAALYSV
ncbi:hypothetical protein EMIHUDRAFT_214245 [Emiliania huxleyi CCMP1516]|uniref:Transglutaminase-like domain-containing protein n=2 Tax=Emiliania huxleyi TaxID=2903 RepID=A0A0D3IKU9_EMIH1|nr:hypothetical protein EMIHUDRAFT_214245 [Emiliania huxleyi CCMP1516]EOD11884.1 hypothetical protein EMIHUDRAFT_214245 [Emiliania huxleyi CCMP1516]|eukprot:XP_005764313.1 hypothetical protein EMIHUDRAFT_214245 [Emiliania huxleyi CCMP1516]